MSASCPNPFLDAHTAVVGETSQHNRGVPVEGGDPVHSEGREPGLLGACSPEGEANSEAKGDKGYDSMHPVSLGVGVGKSIFTISTPSVGDVRLNPSSPSPISKASHYLDLTSHPTSTTASSSGQSEEDVAGEGVEARSSGTSSAGGSGPVAIKEEYRGKGCPLPTAAEVLTARAKMVCSNRSHEGKYLFRSYERKYLLKTLEKQRDFERLAYVLDELSVCDMQLVLRGFSQDSASPGASGSAKSICVPRKPITEITKFGYVDAEEVLSGLFRENLHSLREIHLSMITRFDHNDDMKSEEEYVEDLITFLKHERMPHSIITYLCSLDVIDCMRDELLDYFKDESAAPSFLSQYSKSDIVSLLLNTLTACRSTLRHALWRLIDYVRNVLDLHYDLYNKESLLDALALCKNIK